MPQHFTRYKKALDYIFNLNRKRKVFWEFGFDRMEVVLEKLKNPQDRLKIVHVAGTKGKGSTVSFLSFILRQSYSTGLFTSPSLINTNERISINGLLIPPKEFLKVFNDVVAIYKILPDKLIPSTFETFTILAFEYFKRKKVDIALFEVGMGGRLDATNIVKHPLISVITPISYDHQKVLGNTLGEIAYEKSGIIKNNGIVVVGKQEEEAKKVILDVAKTRNAQVFLYGKDFYADNIRQQNDKTLFDFYSRLGDVSFRNLEMPLLGTHQAENASISIQTALLLNRMGLSISHSMIRSGLKKSFWPGRMEIVNKDPVIVLDGAHNGASALALNNALKLFSGRKIIFLFGILKDKNINSVLSVLSRNKDAIFVLTEVPFSHKRRLDVMQLKKYTEQFVPKNRIFYFNDFLKAFEYSRKIAGKKDVICVTGSLYLVSSVRKLTNHFVFSFNIL